MINESNKSKKPKFILLVLEPSALRVHREKPIVRSQDPRQGKEWVGIHAPRYVQQDFLHEEGRVVLTRLPQDYLGEQSVYTQEK